MNEPLAIYRELDGALLRVGTVESTQGTRRFTYDASYLKMPGARGLSYSLPLREQPFSEDEFSPYFKGLLPEGEALALISDHLDPLSCDYLQLLATYGLDCIGDVIVNPHAYRENRGYAPVEVSHLAALTDSAPYIQQVLHAERLSLAGTQHKVGAYHAAGANEEEGWFLPQGGAPSNCIVKIGRSDLPDLLLIECLCLNAAAACGLNTPRCGLLNPSAPLLYIERFDRTTASNERLNGLPVPLRMHQEDFTQVLGINAQDKYRELHPSTLGTLARFIRYESANPLEDLNALARITLFNYAIGNCDSHLKNLSILYSHDWRSIRLAPAYDLVSTSYYPRFSRRMGMALGTARMLDDVDVSALHELGEQLGFTSRRLRQLTTPLTVNLVPSLRAKAQELDERGFKEALYVFDRLEDDLLPRLEVLASL